MRLVDNLTLTQEYLLDSIYTAEPGMLNQFFVCHSDFITKRRLAFIVS